MSEFVIGQRWVSHTETELGLGIITGVENRRVKISFPAAGEERIYAIQSAPLTRIEHKPGESIQTNDNSILTVLKVIPHQGRLLYVASDKQGNEIKVDELDLDAFVKLSTPKQRLLSGQLDNLRAYQLRCETLLRLHHLQQSPVRGLIGSRTNLLAHQIYIAYEVARRYAPRVLLADEVGLGKTIEAGMIMHYQLHTGLASRVLVVVPESLTHQWLVEMLRRFNLHFALFNEERVDALKEEGGNPFESEQLILCSLDTLTSNPQMFNQAMAADWDMLVVDEAHHLHWSDDDDGHDYRCIESLAEHCRGVLLLTATPEQVGAASHFARLRLLDPARFHDLDSFLAEEKSYLALSDLVQKIQAQSNTDFPADILQKVEAYLSQDEITSAVSASDAKGSIITKLLDRHGTGRVFLRNTRDAIKGFPERHCLPYALEKPACYVNLDGKDCLFPETKLDNEDWLKQDPRVKWLIDKVNDLKPEKVLVICANAKTATTLEKHLQLRVGIRSAAFYEGLSILERDRAAAYFADQEAGAQVLVCSEIGSEGRNFQFAHHLVLFDLPLNPDLLEQRIGRLDRIGQTERINIHVPYLEKTAQEVLFKWYHEGMNIFTESCAAAYAIYEKFETDLNAALSGTDENFAGLLSDTSKHTQDVKQAMHDGRDRLVELNSCRVDVATKIINIIEKEETPDNLMEFMEQMFDVYGVDHEDHSENTWILHPSDQMRLGYFPELGDDSMTVTFDREKALQREDLNFISWEHPMVSESMEMVLKSEVGNTFITTIEKDGVEPGTIMLESYAAIGMVAPKHLQVERFLPLTPLRTLISKDRKDYSKLLSFEKLNILSQKIDRQTALAIIKQIKEEIDKMVDFASKYTDAKLAKVKEEAKQRAHDLLHAEIERMKELKKSNDTIRTEEIEFLEEQLHACNEIIDSAKYEMQALRLVIAQ